MSRYECPGCGGGFPEPGPENQCPWCGQKMDASYSTVKTSSIIGDKPDSDAGQAVCDTLNTGVLAKGTTPCPECGEDMPMTTWTGTRKPKCRDCRREDRVGGRTGMAAPYLERSESE